MTQLSVNELYVISDLHIGGKDRQIFAGKTQLPWLLDQLFAKAKPETTIALVINGDFIDFLAEDDAKYFDAEGAVEKLNRIGNDASFSASFAALGRFASQPHCTLVINLGNHDLEWTHFILDRRCVPMLPRAEMFRAFATPIGWTTKT